MCRRLAVAVAIGGLATPLALITPGPLRAPIAAASPRDQPPRALQHTATALGCASLAWSAWRGGWWADCVRSETSARDGAVTVHRYLAFHRKDDGQFAMETIVETRATDSLRIKSPRFETVTQRDGRVVQEVRAESGYVHRRIWNLSTNPASLLEEREGGGRICRAGFSNQSSEVVHPLCITDYVLHRQRCIVQQPACRDRVKVVTTRYTAIPVHTAAADLRDPDLFRCAAEIGARPEDLVSGKNSGRAVFDVVAVDDAAAATLTLHLRVADATLQPASDAGWLVRDHWELWLASQRADLACDDTADLPGYCQRTQAALDAIDLVIAPRGDGTIQVVPAAGAAPASWASDVHANSDGKELLVELSGALRDWARDGAITVAYSDSIRGTRQDAVIATSPVRPDRPETLGRLGDTLLCDRLNGP